MQTTTDSDLAQRHKLDAWLSMGHVWNIPIYQRHYSWDSDDDAGQVHLFWEVVLEHVNSRLYGKPKPSHYFGSVLVNEQRKSRPPHAARVFDVVDGQQRLTTVQLALLALIHSVRKHGDLAKRAESELRPYLYLKNGTGADHEPILQPTNYDNKQYRMVLFIVSERTPEFTKLEGDDEAFSKSKVHNTFQFFKGKYAEFIRENSEKEFSVEKIFDSFRDTLLYGFDIVLIQLCDTDRPQEVFQSLNTTSKPLTTLDLIRNDVFQRAADAQSGYDHKVCNSPQWQKIEKPFWEKKIDSRLGTTNIEAYLARMLIAELPGQSVKFERNALVKTYRDKFVREKEDILDEVSRMVAYENIYRDLTECEVEYKLPTVDQSGTVKSFGIFAFNVWGNRDFWPAIFIIIKSDLAADEKQSILRLLEAFVIRRHASGFPPDNYNKFVFQVCEHLSKDLSLSSLKDLLLKSDSESTGFPKDEQIIANHPEHNFIKNGSAKRLTAYVLQILARDMGSDADEMEVRNKLQIDHILPQSWYRNPDWKKQLLSAGEDDTSENARKVNNRLHITGNLTLLSGKNNPKKSNRPYSETRKLLCNSPLMMNRKIAEKHCTWDRAAIDERGNELVARMQSIWPHPYNSATII